MALLNELGIAAQNCTKHSFGILDARHNITIKPFVKQGIRNLPLICERNLGKKKTQCNLINTYIAFPCWKYEIKSLSIFWSSSRSTVELCIKEGYNE